MKLLRRPLPKFLLKDSPIGYGVRSTSVNFASVKIDYNAKYDPYKSNGERDDTGVKNLPQHRRPPMSGMDKIIMLFTTSMVQMLPI